MIGDTITQNGYSYVVWFDGSRQSPSLLSDFPRPSTLADLVKDRRMPKGKRIFLTARKEYRWLNTWDPMS